MNKQTVWLEAQARNFATTPNGVRWEAVIFSSEFNRNKYFFEIPKLMRWSKKLEKVLLNNNHSGKYFANSTDKILEINVQTDENGVTECYAVVESTNEEKRANPEMVTGFSIELRVDPKDVIKNENGEYYIDYEWQGMAYLTGELAGSGDTRILSTKTFSQALENNLMNEEQIKALLEAQKTELKAEFSAQSDELKKEFAEKLAEQQSKTVGSYTWYDSEGNAYTTSWESMYKEMTEMTKAENSSEPAFFAHLAEKFGYKKFEETPPVQGQETTPPAENPTLTEIEKQLALKEAHQNKMKTFSSEEQVPNPQDVEKPAEVDKGEVKKFLNLFK